MDKYQQLKKEYDLLQKACGPYLETAGGEDAGSEFEYYIESAMLRIWGANGRYSEDYAGAIEAISGQRRTPVQITRAMLDSLEPARVGSIPPFFARMVDAEFNAGLAPGVGQPAFDGESDAKAGQSRGGFRTKDFIVDLKSLLAGAAFINGDFTIDESNMLSAEMKKLMTYAIGKGVKVDYAAGRIKDRVTPLKEDSYVSPDLQASVSAETIFDALDRDFLRPAGMPKAGGKDGQAPAGNGPIFTEDGPAFAGNGTAGNGPAFAGNGPAFAGGPAQAQAAQVQNAVEVKEDPRTMEELMEELNDLVGLTGIKEDITSLMNFIRITKLREERGLNVPTISYHLVFTGNPGTGKTTVARLVAGLYHRIGILPKGQLVETDRSMLVAGYTGQTALKTMDVIKQAMGGVLFIDEAYALVNDDQDSFGKEAVETILKAMEDHRDELVVIVAGYTELMHKFIESNPGFRSRFSKFFEFPDYTGEELLEIFRKFCSKNGYHMTPEAESWLLIQFNDMYEHRDSHFGNGRTARNVFEKAIHQQANRLAALTGEVAIGDEVSVDAVTGEVAAGETVTGDAVEAGAEPGAAAETEAGPEAGTDVAAEKKTGAATVTDEQLQELTKEDLEAAVEAENRKTAKIPGMD